ncbi:MAG: zinc-dependent peptidase [bacterium]|nr:zinc-dependent peptidase [bacterium]
MIRGWLRSRRRRRYLREPIPAAWRAWLEPLPHARALTDAECARLVAFARAFVEEKRFEGCAGFVVDDEVRACIALQACLIVLGLGLDAYRRVRTVLVYPATYRRANRSATGAVVSEGDAHIAGETVLGGPVVLTWDATVHGGQVGDDGRNLVFHEFAHQIDLLDDYADGAPPLVEDASYRAVIGREFEQHVRAVESKKRTFLDPYGATNPAEFFAVATEAFFERRDRLRDKHPELYAELAAFYQRRQPLDQE